MSEVILLAQRFERRADVLREQYSLEPHGPDLTGADEQNESERPSLSTPEKADSQGQ